MYAWIIPKDMSKPYLSPIFARAIHSGDWPENEKVWHEFCIALDNSKSNLIEIDTYSRDGVIHVVTIDSDNGVDMDLCVKATKIVDPIIDSLNLEIENYVLDVGSKGVDLSEEESN